MCVCVRVKWSPFQPLDKTNYFVSELSVGFEHGHQFQQFVFFVVVFFFSYDNRKRRFPILHKCACVYVYAYVYVCTRVCVYARMYVFL